MQVQPATQGSALTHLTASVVAHGADPAQARKPGRQTDVCIREKMLALQHIWRVLPHLFQDAKEPRQARGLTPHTGDANPQSLYRLLPELTLIH